MTTAHPGYDPNTGECFFPNWGMPLPALLIGSWVNLLKWDGEGEIQRLRLVESGLFGPKDVSLDMSVHQIGVSSHHIVVMDTAFKAELGDLAGFGGGDTSIQSDITRLFILDRSYIDDTTENIYPHIVEFPREAAHFVINYDSSDGHVTMYVGHQCAFDASEFVVDGDVSAVTGTEISSELHGMLSATTDIGVLGKYKINVETGAVVEEPASEPSHIDISSMSNNF